MVLKMFFFSLQDTLRIQQSCCSFDVDVLLSITGWISPVWNSEIWKPPKSKTFVHWHDPTHGKFQTALRVPRHGVAGLHSSTLAPVCFQQSSQPDLLALLTVITMYFLLTLCLVMQKYCWKCQKGMQIPLWVTVIRKRGSIYVYL
jgi:hypothetical protein